MSVYTGRFMSDDKPENENNAAAIRESRQNDKIDSKYGFDRVKDTHERTGYLINMHTTEILDEDRRLVAALDLFFMKMDGGRFKVSIVYQPYFLVLPKEGQSLEVARYIEKKYAGQITRVEHIKKEDLDLHNHLTGLKQTYLKISFYNQNALIKVRRDLLAVMRKNKEREKHNTDYMKMLASSLAQSSSHGDSGMRLNDHLDGIVDIREYDVPFHVRVSIDLKINCGLWYNIRCRPGGIEAPLITPRPDMIERPEPIILAYDIETTKLPLKFPDAQSDQIMMISYMIDGQGYLICNREIIACDVEDFEYTPKPEFEGNFIVFNEDNEFGLIQKFFDHIMEIKPHVIVSYNGDFFDWPFVETRAAVYDLDMKQEIGFSKSREGTYLSRPSMHMDCLCWVKRDSYLPVGSQGLKAVAKSKLRYDPVELDPEEMCKMAVEDPQVLANYSVSDAVATYYLYMKYVNPFIFALATIIPMEPDEVLRKGSGTLCETLLMVQAFHANIVFPNKQQTELNKLSDDGHVLDSETYVGGHVEALESGVFRADIPCRFRLDPEIILTLQSNIEKVLQHAIEVEEEVSLDLVTNLDEIKNEIRTALKELHDIPNRVEQPVIFHLDVGAMYPNIILTNRLQPSSMVNETDCAACDFNKPDAMCKREMEWMWRGEMLPATKNEYQRIQQQLETEKFPPLFPNGPSRAFHELSKEDQAAYEKKRLQDYSRKAYKKTKVTRLETRKSTICQKENSFYVDTVRAFRDRRYEYKGMTKVAKAAVVKAVASGDASEIKAAKGREVLFDSLQLAHKCILNSFYGYVMRRGARWHSMSMAGIVCLTGANIIRKAREIVERIGRPLELDTDGIWCIVPASFPQEFSIHTTHEKKKKFNISYPNAVLNTMVKDHFTNDQYHELITSADENNGNPEYIRRSENSIFFDVDGPYLAMVLPAAKEEGKKLKKRYAVFNFDRSLAELKGFEVKRRGELQLIKIFQSSVFEAFLQGSTLEECYASVAKVADYWLDVLYSKGSNMPDSELFELISENRSMSRKLEDYGAQKSTSISTAKRLAEFLGDQMVKDAGLACKYIISRKPEGSPVTERAIPLAIFQSEPSVRRHYLRRWLKDNTMGDADIRDVLDWKYYIERLGGTVQKIITIPAALQGVSNPVPRVQHPDWLHKRMLEKNDVLKQRRINEIFSIKPKPIGEDHQQESDEDDSDENSDKEEQGIGDIEDFGRNGSEPNRVPVAHHKRKRSTDPDEEENNQPEARTWREALGSPPKIGNSKEEINEWIVYQKKKWHWQWRQKKLRGTQAKRMRSDNEQGASNKRAGSSRALVGNVSIGGFLRRTQRNLIELPWQIIQIAPIDDHGQYNIWLMIDTELHRIKLNIPRIFYVNKRSPAPAEEDVLWKKIHRVLPRSRPVHHLYQYSVSEQVFRDNRLGMLADLATPDIEGIYETQVSLELRALLQLGCVCSVIGSEAKRLASTTASNNIDTFSIEQLEFKTVKYQPYLSDGGNLKHIFLYQHSSANGKREMWGLFAPAIKKAIIVVLDTVRTNQMPSMKNFYTNERANFMQSHSKQAEKSPPLEDLQFEVMFEVDAKIVYRHISKLLTTYSSEKKGPSLICAQTDIRLQKLSALIPAMCEFPQAQIFIADDAAILSGLEWQRNGVKSMVRHFFQLDHVINLMLEQCRYYHLPIGNMPSDPVMFGADLFYARLLQKHNFVLWISPTSRPDLGGREADDNQLLSEFEENISVIQNKSGFYGEVCVELAIDSLAVSALLQASKIQDMEGASSAITFDTIPQASLEEMIGDNPALTTLSSYDSTALCSAAFRVMRSMVNNWLRDVAINRNVFADFQIVHFYRWIRSGTALLYDPALRRNLNNLMRKLFLQIIAEFQRLNAQIIYADFNRIVLNSGKKSIVDAITYVEYIVQNIRNKELFHSINLTYQESWDFLLWIDTANYAGPKAKIPREIRGDITQNSESIIEQAESSEENEAISIDMNWNIAEQLPDDNNCREEFESIMTLFMESMVNEMSMTESLHKITFKAFETVQRLHKGYGPGKLSPALHYSNALVKVLSTNAEIEADVLSFRSNLLRLIGIGEFSDLAVWKENITTYILNEVICKACNHCRDIDLLKDKDRAMINETPVWLCSQCYVYYQNEEIELRLLDVVQRKIMSYTLQDLRCVRCKQIKRENVSALCSCAGTFETLINANELKKLMETFAQVAENHKMDLLKEQVEIFLNNSC